MKIRAIHTILYFVFITSISAQKITILHTNDLHSRLNGFYPESDYTPNTTNDDSTKGGFARLSTAIKQEKNINDNCLVVDAGDFLMGTLFHNLEPETGLQLSLMKKMGYDFVALGNHEFDFGTNTLAQIINKSSERGGIPQLMLGNAKLGKLPKENNDLDILFKKGIILPKVIINKGGIRIGIFSLIGDDAQESVTNAKPVKFTSTIHTARKIVKQLKNDGAQLIIALSHSGIEIDEKNNFTGEDVKLARKVKDIDIIISGHSHTNLKKALKINNTYIAQVGSFGEKLGKIDIEIEGNIKKIHFSQILIDDKILGDKGIQSEIEKQEKLLKETILAPLGLHYYQEIFETDFPLVIDRQNKIEKGNLGPFIADAILHESNNLPGGNTNIAIIPAGMIRGNIMPGISGTQTTADLFNMLSLGYGNDSIPGYPLSRVFLTGKELKKIVEVLLIAYKTGASKYVYYAGLRATYDPNKFFFKKIQSLEVLDINGNFKTVNLNDDKQLYGLVGNSYLLNFVNAVKEMSFGVIQITPKNQEGEAIKRLQEAVLDFDLEKTGIQEGKEWISVINFSKTFSDINNNGVPDVPIKYKEKTNPVYNSNSVQEGVFVEVNKTR